MVARPSGIVMLCMVVLALSSSKMLASSFPMDNNRAYVRMDGKVPPAIVLDAGDDNKLFIPLPCESRVCSALLYKLAELGKIPWHYVNLPSALESAQSLKNSIKLDSWLDRHRKSMTRSGKTIAFGF